MGARIRKRVFIFLLIPLLSAVNFLTDDFIIKLSANILLLVYVGFIIFLRDSLRGEDVRYDDSPEEIIDDETGTDETEGDENGYETDAGEEFKIISKNKSLEIQKSTEQTKSQGASGKSFFKPQDLKQNFTKIATEKVPPDLNHDEHFGFILEKILTVVKEAYLAHSTLFFWYNRKKHRLTLERFSSSSAQEISQRKFEIEDDILSKIVQKEEPELLTDIPVKAEADVIRYYNKPQGIKSFVGAPLFYNEHLAGLLAIDSKVVDAFGIETIYSLGRFVRVISSIIALFDEKFTESQSEARLKALLNILSADKKFESETELYNAVENSVKDILPWDVMAIVSFNSIEQKFRVARTLNKTSLKYAGEHLEIELTGTYVGKSIVTGVPVMLEDTSTNDLPRYAKSEEITFDGSFLAIPLTYDGQNYGVLCFESLKKNVYTTGDVDFLKKATKIFSYIVFSYSSQSMLRSLLSVDVDTKFLNNKSFVKALETELQKAAKVEVPGALALIKIDDFIDESSLFEGDPYKKVLKAITEILKEELTPFNIIGRLNTRIFGVYFFNSSTKEVFLWAEKLRVKIARKPIAVISKQTTFTVSIGVATTTNKTDVDEVVYNAELALKKALEKGGNSVKSI